MRRKKLAILKDCSTYENEYKRSILNVLFFVEQKIKRQNTNVQQRMKWWGGIVMVVLGMGRNGTAAKCNSHLLFKLNEASVKCISV